MQIRPIDLPASTPRTRILSKPNRRRVLAAVVLVHCVAHLAGTTAAFAALADDDPLGYLGGWWHITDPALLRLFGIAWAALAAAFVACAVLVSLDHRRWRRILAATSKASLATCVLALWATAIGIAVNAALIAVGASRSSLSRGT